MRDGSIPALPSRTLKGVQMNNPVITSGSITLKSDLKLGNVINLLFPDGHRNHVRIDSRHNGEYTVSFQGLRDYNEQAIFPFLLSIKRLTLGGEINYIDKDFNVWRHFYDPTKKMWLHQEATLKYDDEGSNIFKLFTAGIDHMSDEKHAPWGKCEDWEVQSYEY